MPQVMGRYPKPAAMGANLVASAYKVAISYAKGNGVKVTPEEAEKRKQICLSCQFYDKARDRCTKCGCSLGKNIGKVVFRALSCPVGKW